MMKTRNVLALLTFLLLTVGLTGCEKDEEPDKDPYKAVRGKWKLIEKNYTKTDMRATLTFTNEKEVIIEMIQSQSEQKEVFKTDYTFKARDEEGIYTLCFNNSYYFICKFYDDKMWLEDISVYPAYGPQPNLTFQRIKK